MKPYKEFDEGVWKIKVNSRTWLVCLEKEEQADRAMNLFLDSRVPWEELSSNHEDAQENIKIIVAKITAQLATEFEITDILAVTGLRDRSQESEVRQRILEYAAKTPVFEDQK